MIYRPRQYRIDAQVVDRLKAEGVAPNVIRDAQKALENSVRTFDRYLERLKNRTLAWTIRQAAIVVDNSLIEKWQRAISEAENKGDNRFETFVIPGAAFVRFIFPEGTVYPCLPVRDPDSGLIYVLRGETYCTAPEILLALQAGAKIEALESVEFSMVDHCGQPERALLPFFSRLIAERARYKADNSASSKIMEKLTKELINSVYGKTAQGVNPRKVVQVDDGGSELLGPSKITESIMASLTTGLARAALSAILLAIERFNRGVAVEQQITVISGTTDGLLIGLPAPPHYSVVDDYYTCPSHEELAEGALPVFNDKRVPGIADVLTRFGCGELLRLLDEYLPIRQMRNSRLELTGDSTFLEIKHFADEVFSYKTRGQTGMLSTGHCSFIAKFGQRTPFSDIIPGPEERKKVMADSGLLKKTIEARWIDDCASVNDSQHEYNFYTLHSFKEILIGDNLDLTQKVTPRKFNSDYDCKREFERLTDQEGNQKISPFTHPFETHAQMRKFRGASQAIRKAGMVASPERVLERIDQPARATRVRGGTPATLTRLVLRGVLQGHIGTSLPLADYTDIATDLNTICIELGLNLTGSKTWTKSDLKNAKRGQWEPGTLPPSLSLLGLLDRLCELFGADLDQAKGLIFATDESLGESVGLVEELAQAILLAPRRGIEPFATMYVEGLLPHRQKILDAFYPHLTESRLTALTQSAFVTGQRSKAELPQIRRLLSRLGIHGIQAEGCARVLAPVQEHPFQDRKTPRNARCTELFVQALHQPDIVPFKVDKVRVLQQFAEYQLTDRLYNSLRQQKFTTRGLSANTANRHQIRRMAKLLGVDPNPFLHALLNR